MRASMLDEPANQEQETKPRRRKKQADEPKPENSAPTPTAIAASETAIILDHAPIVSLADSAVAWDIETGGLPEDQLRALYVEPTFEEFSASCDQRWKPETREAKFQEAVATGWQKFVERAALSPLTGQVVAIGFRHACGSRQILAGGTTTETSPEKSDEAAILSAFWSAYEMLGEGGRTIFAGYNTTGFDVPFLVRRSWILDVPVPASVFDRDRNYICERVFVDLMRRWACGEKGGNGFVKLDSLAKAFGIGGKTVGADGNAVSGAVFASLWFGKSVDDRAKAIEYLGNDVELTWQLGVRMGVL